MATNAHGPLPKGQWITAKRPKGHCPKAMDHCPKSMDHSPKPMDHSPKPWITAQMPWVTPQSPRITVERPCITPPSPWNTPPRAWITPRNPMGHSQKPMVLLYSTCTYCTHSTVRFQCSTYIFNFLLEHIRTQHIPFQRLICLAYEALSRSPIRDNTRNNSMGRFDHNHDNHKKHI